MPKKFPPEFKRDVVTVARRGDLTYAEVAADFDISVESVRRWVRQADIDDGIRDGLTSAEQPEHHRTARRPARSARASADGQRSRAHRLGAARLVPAAPHHDELHRAGLAMGEPPSSRASTAAAATSC